MASSSPRPAPQSAAETRDNTEPLTDAERDALRALAGQIADYCSYPRDVGAVYDALERDLRERKRLGSADRVTALRFFDVLGVSLPRTSSTCSSAPRPSPPPDLRPTLTPTPRKDDDERPCPSTAPQ